MAIVNMPYFIEAGAPAMGYFKQIITPRIHISSCFPSALCLHWTLFHSITPRTSIVSSANSTTPASSIPLQLSRLLLRLETALLWVIADILPTGTG
jgi:hypothetical protein